MRHLKSLGAHAWDLSGVVLARQQAYARQLQARRPIKSQELRPTTQLIEAVCFLRVTLLELTDTALQQASRRTQQLVRSAAERARAAQAREGTNVLRQAGLVRAVLHDEAKDWRQRVLEAQKLLAEVGDGAPVSFASRVRKALAGDTTRVHGCLMAVRDLDFRGQEADAGFTQWQAWQRLRDTATGDAPPTVDLPDVGAAWRAAVQSPDRKAGWHAFEASTMLALRRSLRRGSVWIDHSLSFRGREQLLIPARQWEEQRERHVELLGMSALHAAALPVPEALNRVTEWSDRHWPGRPRI